MAKTKTPPPPPCDWTPVSEGDYYETGCGHVWMFLDGGPKDNKMHYCPYCGRRLRERKGRS